MGRVSKKGGFVWSDGVWEKNEHAERAKARAEGLIRNGMEEKGFPMKAIDTIELLGTFQFDEMVYSFNPRTGAFEAPEPKILSSEFNYVLTF